MPKVSIIIPTFNSIEYLPLALESVLGQTLTDYEVIIVDDGSTDSTKEWGNNLRHPNVQFLSQLNQGCASARNAGLAKASGEYIAFLDADDIWVPSKLEKQACVLDQFPKVGLAYGWVGSINATGQKVGKIRKHYDEGNVWKTLILRDITECGSVPMIRRECFDKVGTFDTTLSYAQGWDMWIRISAKYSFKVIKEALTYYRSHPGNHSKNWSRMEPNYQRIIEKNCGDISSDFQDLKSVAYSHAYLRIAWKIFQNHKKPTEEVIEYMKKASKASSKILVSGQYIRLKIALQIVNTIGFESYNNLRVSMHTVKSLLSTK